MKGKVVIVTGGTSGIGAACTRHFAACDAKVVAASIQTEEGTALVESIIADGGQAAFCHTDVSDESSVQALVAFTLEQYGRIDAVHANAGVWGKGKVTDFTDRDWDKLMGVNVKGTLWTAKHTVPVMEQNDTGGVFLVTTSVAAHTGFPSHALYCATKASLEALVRCLAVDHAGKVRAVGVSPGTIDTPMLAATCEGWDAPVEELYAQVEQKIPVRRLGRPEDIARTAGFLISEAGSYINGTIVTVDGGTGALPPW